MKEPLTSASGFTAIGAISIALWGGVLPLVKLGCESLGSYLTIFGAQGIAGICGLIFLTARGDKPLNLSKHLSYAFFVRLIFFSGHILAAYSAVSLVDRSAMPAVIFCNYLWPGLVLVYSVAFGGLKIARPLYLLIGSAIILLALLMEFGWHGVTGVRTPHEWLGICIAILGANLWGLYSAFTKRWSNLPGGAGLTPLFQIATAVIAYVLALFLPASTTGGSGLIWPVLLVGVFNFVAYMCWDVGIRRGSVVTLSLLADFIPWLSLAVTSFLLSVPIGLSTKISAGVLVVGALVARLGTLERKRAP